MDRNLAARAIKPVTGADPEKARENAAAQLQVRRGEHEWARFHHHLKYFGPNTEPLFK